MDFRYGASFGVSSPEAYERLLLDCILGDSTLYARRDMTERGWEIVMPVLEAWQNTMPDFPNYEAGTWGLTPRRTLSRPTDVTGDDPDAFESHINMTTELSSGLDVVRLEQELTALWSSMSEEDHDGITRSCVLNLIIYGPISETDHRLDETLIEVTEHHPSRAIVLMDDRANPGASLQSWVNSRCTLPADVSRQVCCEQINIKASGEKLREAPSAISSLVLADLPCFCGGETNYEQATPSFDAVFHWPIA
jgi:hypothetical protein